MKPTKPKQKKTPEPIGAFDQMRAAWGLNPLPPDPPAKLNAAPQKKTGPKPIEISPRLVRELATIQCTYEEMAAVIGLKRRQFISRVQSDEALRDAIDAGWDMGKASLRRAQFAAALAGDKTQLVWLGKQYLNQRDQVGLGDPNGKPLVNLESVRAYIRQAPAEGEDLKEPPCSVQ